MPWVTCDRPGFFGAKRAERHAEYDRTYGPTRWRLAWEVDGHVFAREAMTMLYEDAYFAHLSAHPDVLEQLLAGAEDVYDDDPSNIFSGFDYTIQETASTHVQDIAIRRVVARLGRVFTGTGLVQIRSCGDHPLSRPLSPGRVPFHRPQLIADPPLPGWWDAGSIEDFYQSNKILQRWEADR